MAEDVEQVGAGGIEGDVADEEGAAGVVHRLGALLYLGDAVLVFGIVRGFRIGTVVVIAIAATVAGRDIIVVVVRAIIVIAPLLAFLCALLLFFFLLFFLLLLLLHHPPVLEFAHAVVHRDLPSLDGQTPHLHGPLGLDGAVERDEGEAAVHRFRFRFRTLATTPAALAAGSTGNQRQMDVHHRVRSTKVGFHGGPDVRDPGREGQVPHDDPRGALPARHCLVDDLELRLLRLLLVVIALIHIATIVGMLRGLILTGSFAVTIVTNLLPAALLAPVRRRRRSRGGVAGPLHEQPDPTAVLSHRQIRPI